MTKTYSKVAIDYSKGMQKNSDGTLTPNKVGCFVDNYKTAYEFAKAWKSNSRKELEDSHTCFR